MSLPINSKPAGKILKGKNLIDVKLKGSSKDFRLSFKGTFTEMENVSVTKQLLIDR